MTFLLRGDYIIVKRSAKPVLSSNMANKSFRGHNGRKDEQHLPSVSPVISLREAMNRLFHESLLDPFEGFSELMPVRQAPFPRVNISENDKTVTVVADVPGIDPSKIEIEAGEQSLTLSGIMEHESEKKGKKFYRFERSYGEFRRSLPLPAKVKPEEVSAKSKNGVLTITLPKVEAEKRKKIKVDAGE